jgi:hypothetical protein
MAGKKGSQWKEHKYVERTGSPGNYKYVYPGDPHADVDGAIFSQDFIDGVTNFIWPKATAEEQELQDLFVQATGEAMPAWQDPYVIDRVLRIIDGAFIVSGVGIVAKGATTGARYVISKGAREAAKAAAKRKLKSALANKALIRGASAKAKRQILGKAVNTYFNTAIAAETGQAGMSAAKAAAKGLKMIK